MSTSNSSDISCGLFLFDSAPSVDKYSNILSLSIYSFITINFLSVRPLAVARAVGFLFVWPRPVEVQRTERNRRARKRTVYFWLGSCSASAAKRSQRCTSTCLYPNKRFVYISVLGKYTKVLFVSAGNGMG